MFLFIKCFCLNSNHLQRYLIFMKPSHFRLVLYPDHGNFYGPGLLFTMMLLLRRTLQQYPFYWTKTWVNFQEVCLFVFWLKGCYKRVFIFIFGIMLLTFIFATAWIKKAFEILQACIPFSNTLQDTNFRRLAEQQ